jgi:hypothetical protein
MSTQKLVGTLGLTGALWLAGCLEKGGDTTHTEAALTLVDGVAAYQDIHSNVETDQEAAKDALLKFIKAPIAAAIVMGQPFEGPSMQGLTVSAVQQPLSLPACLMSTGKKGCGKFNTTADGCDVSDFNFKGGGEQDCDSCNPASTCRYTWDLALKYTNDPLFLDLKTNETKVVVTPSDLSMSTTFNFTLRDGSTTPPTDTEAKLRVCSCGPITFAPSCKAGKSPTSGAVVIRALSPGKVPGGVIKVDACARVRITACNKVKVTKDCTCPDGSTCV